MSDLICHICHQVKESVHVTGGGYECNDCYVPPEKRGDFAYIQDGNTDGYVIYPKETCGICGQQVFQPYPTGLWMHVAVNCKEDAANKEFSTQDHEVRFATLDEHLLLGSKDTGKRRGGVGSLTYYDYGGFDDPDADLPFIKKRAVEMRNCTECLIHRKYWTKKAKINKRDEIKLLGEIDDHKIEDFLSRSERPNILQFVDFVKKKLTLKENPKSPLLVYEFYFAKRTRSYWSDAELLQTIKEKDMVIVPVLNLKIMIGRKQFFIGGIHESFHSTKTKDIVKIYLTKKLKVEKRTEW